MTQLTPDGAKYFGHVKAEGGPRIYNNNNNSNKFAFPEWAPCGEGENSLLFVHAKIYPKER